VSNRLKQAVAGFRRRPRRRSIRSSRARQPGDRPQPHDTGTDGDGERAVAVLDRACSDCHSNMTVWPWYTQVAPLSWLMAYGVREGRQAVNFSEWTAYQPARQRSLLVEACRDVSTGKMPGAYAVLHPDMRLSAQDIETICAASRQGGGTHDAMTTTPFAAKAAPRCLDAHPHRGCGVRRVGRDGGHIAGSPAAGSRWQRDPAGRLRRLLPWLLVAARRNVAVDGGLDRERHRAVRADRIPRPRAHLRRARAHRSLRCNATTGSIDGLTRPARQRGRRSKQNGPNASALGASVPMRRPGIDASGRRPAPGAAGRAQRGRAAAEAEPGTY